jgi:fucose permease
VAGGVLVLLTVAASMLVGIPPTAPAAAPPRPAARPRRRLAPALVTVFAIVALEFALSFWVASYLNESVGLGRGLAVTMVSGLYAANLVGRLVVSRLARRMTTARLLLVAVVVSLVGLPVLLAASGAGLALVGLVVTGAGVGALFPLASSLHVGASAHGADVALGQVLLTAAAGQVVGPLAVAAIAQRTGLRVALLLLPVFALMAAGGVALHHAHLRQRQRPPREPAET